MSALPDLFTAFRETLGRTALPDETMGRVFLRLVRALVHVDEVVVFAYHQADRPLDLFSTFSPADYHVFVALYQAGPYLLDPFCRHARERRAGLYRMRDLAPDRFYSSEYHRTYYVQTGLAEEVGFFVPVEGATLVLSLMRREASGGFSEAEMAPLHQAEALVSDLVRLYWGGVAARFGARAPAPGPWARLNLTEREAAIVELVLQGHSSESIALRLGITTGTVKVHRRNVYRKLGISSQTQLLSLYLAERDPDMTRPGPLSGSGSFPVKGQVR
ncbi:helix-turn-helix transcriptional regulator [Stagnihabitans tardus]|uniref:Helix-turn-helix transcriptional regulator n=1 Tax=Stagnihabitans tardus TaxID=2699202 RepID=A0AAE4YBD4_9RHOB|nr:helix-turn-helix transcriptional regulator [Stagnihabitans tardus]NBZ88562.1 helix-turn-helix transcriptional regulator [Stagnihabitans tardus]